MADNFYYNCPAKSYWDLTDYRLNAVINDEIKRKNNITSEEEFRQFIKDNGVNGIYKMPKGCWNNESVHTYPTRQNPTTFYEESIKSIKNVNDITNKFYKK